MLVANLDGLLAPQLLDRDAPAIVSLKIVGDGPAAQSRDGIAWGDVRHAALGGSQQVDHQILKPPARRAGGHRLAAQADIAD